MFRSSSVRQSDLAECRLVANLDRFGRTATTWFDGTAASVDERLAHLDRIIGHARDTASRLGSTPAGRRCVVALPVLEQTRRELAAARGSLLSGFSDRQTGERISAGRRTAKGGSCPECGQHLHDEYARLGHGHGPNGEVYNAPPQYGHESLGDYQKRFFGGYGASPEPTPGHTGVPSNPIAPPPPPQLQPPGGEIPARGLPNLAPLDIGGPQLQARRRQAADTTPTPGGLPATSVESNPGGTSNPISPSGPHNTLTPGDAYGLAPDVMGGSKLGRTAAGGQPIPGGPSSETAPPTNQVPSSTKSGPGLRGFGDQTPPGTLFPGGPGPGTPQGPGTQDPASQMGYHTAAGGDVAAPGPWGMGSAGVPGVPSNNMPSLGLITGPTGGGGATGTVKGGGGGVGLRGPQQSPQQRQNPAGSDLTSPGPGKPGIPNRLDPSMPVGPLPSPVEHESSRLHRAIELGSRDFLASQNTDDRDELLIRARHYADNETSTLPVTQARPLVAAFVGRVEELIAQRPRIRQAARQVTAFEDFPDQLMY